MAALRVYLSCQRASTHLRCTWYVHVYVAYTWPFLGVCCSAMEVGTTFIIVVSRITVLFMLVVDFLCTDGLDYLVAAS